MIQHETNKQIAISLDTTTYHRDCLTLLSLIQNTITAPTDLNNPDYLTDGEIIDTISDLLTAAKYSKDTQ